MWPMRSKKVGERKSRNDARMTTLNSSRWIMEASSLGCCLPSRRKQGVFLVMLVYEAFAELYGVYLPN